MRKNFVTFYSPGTFVAETSTKPIDKWDVDQAVEMARSVSERYNARPYGFSFSARERRDEDLDSHEVARGPMYYLGGRIETLEEIEARNDPKEEILRWNMRENGYSRVITGRWAQLLRDDDVVLDVTL